jgi:hypothetical protein
LGPLLTASSEPPEQLVLKYWFNPVVVFAAHYSISTAVKPFTDENRRIIIGAAWFIVPSVVFLYQAIILQYLAKRRFLKPLNDRGQPSWPSRFVTRNIRRRMESAMVAHWYIMLFGPILDGLFWIILIGSEGKRSVDHLNFPLLASIVMIMQWYFGLGTSDPSIVLGTAAKRIYFVIIMLCFVGLVYDVYTKGFTRDVYVRYVELVLQVSLVGSVMPFVLSIARLISDKIQRRWGAGERPQARRFLP